MKKNHDPSVNTAFTYRRVPKILHCLSKLLCFHIDATLIISSFFLAKLRSQLHTVNEERRCVMNVVKIIVSSSGHSSMLQNGHVESGIGSMALVIKQLPKVQRHRISNVRLSSPS